MTVVNGEITYDNFILNNKKLGKGKAIVTLFFGFIVLFSPNRGAYKIIITLK